MLLLSLAASAQEEKWVTLSEPGSLPLIQVADDSAKWEGKDKVGFAFKVGEGQIWLEMTRDQQTQMIEAGQWYNGTWTPAQKIEDQPHPVPAHMMVVWEHFFKE